MSLDDVRGSWEDLARLDPYWAVYSTDDGKHGNWDVEAFFATGEEEIARELAYARGLVPSLGSRAALDFGCGVGRLSRALSTRYEQVVGVDLSDEMLSQAARLNADRPNVEWVHNTRPDLSVFGDRRFDLIYTNIVLQHSPDAATIRSYVREFIRVLDVGGVAIFQAPASIDLRRRLQLRRRAYGALRRAGVSRELIHRRLGLTPMHMTAVPEPVVLADVSAAGGRVLEAREHDIGFPGYTSRTYFATRDR